MRTFWQDSRISVRMLVKSPTYAAIVTATLALAIGANTVIFGFANILVLRPLPIGEPEGLAWIYTVDPQRSATRSAASWQDYVAWRDRMRSVSALAAWQNGTVTMTGRGEAERLVANRTTANMFDVWQLPMALGRAYHPDEDRPGAACTVVLAHRFWTREFRGARSAVGDSLTLDGRSCTVVGVLPPAIEIGNLGEIDVWLPLAVDASTAPPDRRVYRTAGRMRPGVTVEQVTAEARAISEQLQREHTASHAGWTSRALGTREAITGPDTWVVLTLLIVVVTLVLVIACANVANLMLARAAGRRGELAVRAALGASRGRIVQQLVTEALVLGLAGGIMGLAVGAAGMRLVRASSSERFFDLLTVDGNVVAFAILLSFVAPLLFSLLPALHSTSAGPNDVLKDSGHRTLGGAGRRSRHALVVAQVALAISLLVVAGLVVRTMVAITRIDLGVNPHALLTLQLDLPEWRHSNAEVPRFYGGLLDDLERAPSIEAVGATSVLPLVAAPRVVRFDIDGRPAPSEDQRPWAGQTIVTNAYLDAAGIPVLRGRGFIRTDGPGTQPIAIVSAEMARRYWGSPDEAVGAGLTVAGPDGTKRSVRVVGVVGNTANPDIESPPDPVLYLPFAQHPVRSLGVVVRTGNPAAAGEAARTIIRAADPMLPVFRMRTLADAIEEELSSSWMLTSLFVAFGVLALLLSSTGLYGVMSYTVGQRTQEIGVRVALGAMPSNIRQLVFRQAFRLLALGAVTGLVGAGLLGQALASELYGVTPFDLPTYGGVLAVVAASAFFATWIPTRRAMRLDPVQSLKA
jgi:predicted permease